MLRRAHLRTTKNRHSFLYKLAPLFSGLYAIKRHAWIGGGVILGLSAWITWYFGYMGLVTQGVESAVIQSMGRFGYTFENLYIQGRTHTTTAEILSALQMGRGASLFAQSPQDIKARVEALAWVSHAIIRRDFAGHVFVNIVEKTPIALWQHRQKFYLIDETGSIIQKAHTSSQDQDSDQPLEPSAPLNPDQLKQFAHLPVVVGLDAPSQTPELLHMLKPLSEVRHHMTGIVRVHKRRWDILLGGVTVKLPENDVDAALNRLNFILTNKKLNLHELKSIDLRIPKQMIAEVSPTTAKRLNLQTTHS